MDCQGSSGIDLAASNKYTMPHSSLPCVEAGAEGTGP